MTDGDFKDLTRRTASDKILRHKAFNIAKNSKYDAYKRELDSTVYNFFNKKTSSRTVKNENMSDQCPLYVATGQLAEALHKQIIIKFEKRKKHPTLIDHIWSADLANT